MNVFKLTLSVFALLSIGACTPIQSPIITHYKLESFSHKKSPTRLPYSLLISQPEAMAGYQTEQMLYIKKPFQLSAFSENAWITTPANMLYPLLIQTFQHSRALSAIASSPYADRVNYRLDTQIIAMQQNFLVKPSQFQLAIKVVITEVNNNHVLASRLFSEAIPCPSDTPYGGVIAANRATTDLTEKIRQFVLLEIKRDKPFLDR